MEFLDVLAVALFICFATLVQGTVGFGFALVFTPLATLAVGAQPAIATSILVSTGVSLMLYVEHRPRASMRSIAPLAVAGIAGTPLGLLLLVRADESTLRLLVGIAVLASALLTLSYGSLGGERRQERLPLMFGAGLVGGVTRGALSIGGPPVLLYQHWVGGGADEIRSRMFAFFVWFGIPGVVIAAATGIFTQQVLLLTLAGAPAAIIGAVLGRLVRPRLSDRWFARASMSLLALTSSVAIIGASSVVLG